MPDGDRAREQTQEHGARQSILFAFTVAACAAVAIFAARILLVLFAGLLFAVVLNAVATFVERHTRLPYKVAVGACVVLLVASTALGIYFTAPVLVAQFRALGGTLPQAIDKVRQTLHLSPAVAGKPGQMPDWGPNIEKFATHAVTALGTTIEIFGGLVVFFFVGVYGALDPASYSRVLLWCVPSTRKRRVTRILAVSGGNLQRWLLGRLVAMLFVGVASGVVFWILHVPLAFPLAVFAGLLTFVEYVGAFAAAVPPILLAFSQGPSHALWVLLAFTALHVIEGYILTPLLARTAVRFPPASTLASQALFSALLGPMGLTFATPLLIVGVAALQEWRKNE
jgi:predicted PurR-regulated permease PerM